MKVLFCGDRNWVNRDVIRTAMASLPSNTTIIHGAARGADSIAGEVAAEQGRPVAVFPADWERYGRAAGPIRNQQILDQHPDLVYTFHDELSRSKGTLNMVTIAKKAGVRVVVFTTGASS